MAELFENMEKMDIQAERKKTQDAIENGIRFFIESCQELSIPQQITLDKLIVKYHLYPEIATQKLEQYWKP